MARNIEDIIVFNKSIDSIKSILKRMGKGGILYASSIREAEEIYEELKNEFKIGLVSAKRKSEYNLFEEGKIDYLVGTAFYYGTLVRGLDLPERIRYAVFIGAPTIKVKTENINNVTPKMLKVLALIFRREDSIKKYLPIIQVIDKHKYNNEREELKKEIVKLLELSEKKAELDVVIRKGEVIFPDLKTYIQGSGRTSRLFTGGLTKGASFLLEDDEEVLKAFINRAEIYDLKFKKIDEVDFNSLIKEIDESRIVLKQAKSCEEAIKPALLIVESPTKAKQISRFFGHPAARVIKEGKDSIVLYEVPTSRYILTVTASLGHLVDLVTNQGFFGVTINNGFTPLYITIKRCKKCLTQFTEEKDSCPKCGSTDIEDAKNRINIFRKIAGDTGFVIVGTDPDSEGEKIAWDIKNLLSNFSIVKRAEFHEVTKRAVQEALENLKDVNESLVKAQIVRRIEDRWIGFALSQKLWKTFNNMNLSAGRAQTPVLGWIVERAKESRKKVKIGYIPELDLSIENLDKEWVNVKVVKVKEELKEVTPLPPYTTDTMLKDGNALIKASAKEVMKLAQDLFENGLITYHRTDSTRVSDLGKRIAKEFLSENYQGREWFTEGAHECIRPTRALPKDVIQRLIQEGVIQIEKLTLKHLILYDLIFRRFMASQCKPYKIKVNRYIIEVNEKKIEKEIIVEADGKAIELYKWSVQIKKPLPEGEFKFKVEIKYMPKVFPYAQFELIREMHEKGIGRPSTYATIIDKIFLRGYSFERKGRVLPTKKGIQVYYFLKNNYEKFVSEERTKLLEAKMDAIEKGEVDYKEVLTELYSEVSQIT
ncbi:MAG: reverse gyrase, partial [Candidatus Bathyarchaeia archaeon]